MWNRRRRAADAADTFVRGEGAEPNRASLLLRRRGPLRLHVTQLRRYEGDGAQPTLDVVRQLAIALSVSADQLVFDTGERGPNGDLRLHLEAVQHLDDEKAVILRHEARRYAPAS